ncbi:NAD(P)H-dependent oxidoreductase [Demequina sp. NBRC 110053]|uniref:NAD(P)H-dependent oxidoreductase n=1 Tax=Demequina sp. NBRC 110053 TaxID=1570342 RepID=UPI000A06B104|nr:NAD(P)H-dependent oxidoreductase [Demequina sp. NBRC 110053]
MSRILVVVGSPLAGSLTHALARSYADAARVTGAEVDVLDLAAEPVPDHPATRADLRAPRTPADPDLDPVIAPHVERLLAADHLALFFPQWWGTYPAAFKAWIDRVILSGSSFAPTDGQSWTKLLTGRTARIVMTMDSPRWWNWWMYRDAAVRSVRVATLWYVGVKTIGVTRIPDVKHADRARLERAIAALGRHGAADAARGSTVTAARTAAAR